MEQTCACVEVQVLNCAAQGDGQPALNSCLIIFILVNHTGVLHVQHLPMLNTGMSKLLCFF
jgi:hypothetical protein